MSLAQLNAPLQPISRRPPQFPVKLRASATEGEALVEFLVGEDGRVRLPRVLSATAPEFGYAAVQAVAAWEYEPPRVGGKTAVVRARIPFVFNTKDSAGR